MLECFINQTIQEMKQLFLIILLAFVIKPYTGFAQQAEASMDLILGLPQGQFRDEIDRIGAGIGFNIGVQPKQSPLQFGLKLGFINYGIDSRNTALSSTIPDITVRVDNNYNIFQGHLYTRIIPPSGGVRPYIEGLAGLNYLYTQTSIIERGTYEEILSDTNFDDTAFSYGFGGGMQIYLARQRQLGSNIYLDLRANYLVGNSADYLKKGSIKIQNGRATYEVYRSSTDLLLINVGLNFTF